MTSELRGRFECSFLVQTYFEAHYPDLYQLLKKHEEERISKA